MESILISLIPSAKATTDTHIDILLCCITLLIASVCYLLAYCLCKTASMSSRWEESEHFQTKFKEYDDSRILTELNLIHQEMNSNGQI